MFHSINLVIKKNLSEKIKNSLDTWFIFYLFKG